MSSNLRLSSRSILKEYNLIRLGRRYYNHGNNQPKINGPDVPNEDNTANKESESILNLLSGNNNIIKQINKLERINDEHELNILRLINKLSYIQKNIGVYNYNKDFKAKNKIIANELIDMPIDKVTELVRNLTNGSNIKNSTHFEIENQLIILLSHLVFRNSLTCDLFSRIVTKLQLINLKKIHYALITDPNGFIKDWNNERSRIICGLSLAARYKMLKDFTSVQIILKNEFKDIWMNTLINNISILRGNDLKNIVNVVDGLIEYGYLVTCIIKVNNGQFIYSFWENHPNDGIIKSWLEHDTQKKPAGSKLNKYQKFIIQLYTNPSISTVNKWKNKVLNISKKLKLSILNENQINNEKFNAFIELLLNEMNDEMTNDTGRKAYFNDIVLNFEKFKQDNNVLEHDEVLVKTV